MANVISIIASKACSTNRQDTSKSTNFLAVNNRVLNYKWYDYETALFWDNSNIEDDITYNLKYYIESVSYGSYMPSGEDRYISLGCYTTGKTYDTVAWDDARTYIGQIKQPKVGQQTIQVTGAQIKKGLVLYTERSQQNSIWELGADLGRITQGEPYAPRLEFVIEDATVSNLVLDQLDTDKNIVCSWSSTNQKYLELQALQGSNVVYSINGTTVNSVSIPYNTLPAGEVKFRVRVGNGFGSNIYWSNWIETTKTLIKKTPSVPLLEPDRIQVRREIPISVTATASNVTNWIYECIQNGITKFTDSGTAAIATTIPSNVLSNGTAKNRIIATYIPEWATSSADYRTAVKETEFTVYGKPSNPILQLDTTYSTPYPLFRWANATEQISYRLKIKDGAAVILDSSEVFGASVREHKFTNTLPNKKTYTAELQIKNQYGLWSDVVTATFKVDFAELAQPTFNVYADPTNASIVINLESVEDANFHFHEIHRREINGTWIRMAIDLQLIDEYKDYGVASGVEYEYKVRAVDANTAYTDSVIKPCKVSFNKTILSVPFSDAVFSVRYNLKKSIDNAEDKTFVLYSGLNKPKMIEGTADYKIIGLSCSFKSPVELEEFKAIARQRVLLLRDGRGLKLYGNIHSIKDTYEDPNYYNVSFTFTETYYKEGDWIEAEQLPLRFVDSEW
ncbi:hypothetical protein CS063_13775 [Sporanaerobium hydrogeniformans]|uniref:Uncharacterized protein n=1 Tax=Sporanaerobium hydrogeniformans TaxID=3072179 RepID=A0AC61DB14_9FIRM|nr:hypothetical protein [Sporanaerobium hydrogeniformans]PHV69782.1 hypothetical protein CS063_13775 [Sporanaerobium hydrogeniformans]